MDNTVTKGAYFGDKVKRSLLYLPLVIWSIITIFPFFYMILLATKSSSQIFNTPPPLLFSSDAIKHLLQNYKNLVASTEFFTNFLMTVYVAGSATILSLIFCSLSGYGFAMYEFRGKKLLFASMLITMMIPTVVSIVPYFAQMRAFGWLNTGHALYLPVAANAFGVFLMRQFITVSVPPSLVQAARIDGASEFQTYYKIVLPIIRPALGSLGIIVFLTTWNDFMRALVIMTDKAFYTIPVALNTMKGMQSVDYGAIMVGSSISILPIVLLFIFMSKWIIARVTEGAVKG
ncbi:MAG: carbohydrate ABC transporter permease [Spirochaetes bacterium]|nr:carbohydrate ABC transporter permease [Spirochaetota bacterium]